MWSNLVRYYIFSRYQFFCAYTITQCFVLFFSHIEDVSDLHPSAVASPYLALNLPGLGDGRQVTGRHHHGPGNTRAILRRARHSAPDQWLPLHLGVLNHSNQYSKMIHSNDSLSWLRTSHRRAAIFPMMDDWWIWAIITCLSFGQTIGWFSTLCGRFTSIWKTSRLSSSCCADTVLLSEPQKGERMRIKGWQFLTDVRNEWMVSVSDSVRPFGTSETNLAYRVCFALTLRSLCAWSPASCTWSSRSSSRRSWTGQRSSGTWPSSCPEAEKRVLWEPAGSSGDPHWILVWLGWLEVKSQVCGNDGDVHQVNHKVVLAAVQILVDVQCLNMQRKKHIHMQTFLQIRKPSVAKNGGKLRVSFASGYTSTTSFQ